MEAPTSSDDDEEELKPPAEVPNRVQVSSVLHPLSAKITSNICTMILWCCMCCLLNEIEYLICIFLFM